MLQQGNAINQGYASQVAGAPAPRTISSAISRMESLNKRLSSMRVNMEKLADQIGGPRAGQIGGKVQEPPSLSVVSRINDSADYAHAHIDEIEGLMNSIGRSLG